MFVITIHKTDRRINQAQKRKCDTNVSEYSVANIVIYSLYTNTGMIISASISLCSIYKSLAI